MPEFWTMMRKGFKPINDNTIGNVVPPKQIMQIVENSIKPGISLVVEV